MKNDKRTLPARAPWWAGLLIAGSLAAGVAADEPELHGFYEITRHVNVEGSCGETSESSDSPYRYFHLEGSTVDQAGFDFDRYFLSLCTSRDTDDCDRGRVTRLFEVQGEDREIEQGILVENTGSAWHERGGGKCRFGWSRSVLERNGDTIRILSLEEAVAFDRSEYDGSCSASEETAHLLEGSCDEAEILEGIAVAADTDTAGASPDSGTRTRIDVFSMPAAMRP